MFTRALEALAEPERSAVELHFQAWLSAGGDWAQISLNARAETALPASPFAALLRAFADHLGTGTDPGLAWVLACRGHHFCGADLPVPARPHVLGRAIPLKSYANLVAEFSGLTPDTEERLLRQYADAAVPGHRFRTLRGAAIGMYVIWATFDRTDHNSSPFATLTHTTPAIRTALGLGTTLPTDTLVLIAYQCTPDLRLHRPTIAEAGSYSWYRPYADQSHPHGYTCSLDTGSTCLPEVVHRPITGQNIRLPYHLTRPV